MNKRSVFGIVLVIAAAGIGVYYYETSNVVVESSESPSNPSPATVPPGISDIPIGEESVEISQKPPLTATTAPVTVSPPASPPPIASPPSDLETLAEKIAGESVKFSSFSRNQQEFLLKTDWIRDGLESSDIEYLEGLSTDFEPGDSEIDRDGGGWPDIYEIGALGDVFNGDDDDSLEILETEHLEIVYHHGVKPRFRREVILAVEKGAERNRRVLGDAPKVAVNIYFDRGEFRNAFGGDIENVIGFAANGEMHVLSPEYIIYRTEDEFSRVVIHEYSHLATPNIGYAWLAEGYAKYISRESYYGQLSGCIDYEFPLSFEYGETDREKYRTYDCGQSAVEYLAKTYGEDALGKAVKSGFVSAIGISEEEFVEEYKADLARSIG